MTDNATPATSATSADGATHDHTSLRRSGLWARITAPLRRGWRTAVARGGTPAPERAANGTVRCAGCGQRHRDDQAVPDPDQFTGTDRRNADGSPRAIVVVEAPMVWCLCGQWFHAVGCFSEHRTVD
jgi:hypothetical protein